MEDGGTIRITGLLDERDYQLLSETHKTLKTLRDDHHDEIPEHTVHSNSPGKKNYKARKAWFTQLYLYLGLLEHNNQLPDYLKGEFDRLHKNYTDNNKRHNHLTQPEDIAAANKLLDNVISYLETRTGSRTQ